MVMSMLINTMEPQIARLCMLLNSSKVVWDKVKKLYGQQQNFAHIFNLKQELSKIKQGSKTSSQYGTEILTRWEELQLYLPPTTDLEEIQRRAEQDLIYTYLGGLDSSYEAIKSQIMCSTELPSIDSVMATIQREETRRANMNIQTDSDTAETKAYAARMNPNVREGAKTRGAPNNNDKCDHCKNQGHTRDGCWHLHPHLRPNRDRGNNGGGGRKWEKERRFGGMSQASDLGINEGAVRTGSDPVNKTDPAGSSMAGTAQLTQLLTQLNQLLQQQNPGSFLYKSNFSCHSFYDPKSANLCQNTNNWIIDSGATDHMTCDQTKLQNFKKVIDPQHVVVANGHKAQIYGIGTTLIFAKNVKNILCLPDFNSNLLSVGKITQDLNCNVIFSPKKVIFQDRVSGKMIGEGTFKNGLYYLEENMNKCFVSLSPINRDKLLHWRFGHPSDQVLNKLFCHNLDSSNCDVCKFSKQTRLPFSLSTSVSNKCFDLIHSDVWGPAPVDSYNNFKYFVTFIDDYSRTT
jgi:gag-polypeptide of LTR copia-type